MGIAREVRQEGGHLGLRNAVFHTCLGLHVGLAFTELRPRPQGMVRGHAVAVGQQLLHIGDVPVRKREVVGHYAAQVEQKGGHRINLIGRQGLGRIPRHRTANVVPQRRQGGELHQGRAARKTSVIQARHMAGLDVVLRRAACKRAEDLVALAEDTMTRSAFSFPDVLPFRDRAGTRRQALEVGANVDVPGGDLFGGGGAPDARIRRWRRLCVCQHRNQHRRGQHYITTVVHS